MLGSVAFVDFMYVFSACRVKAALQATNPLYSAIDWDSDDSEMISMIDPKYPVAVKQGCLLS